MCLRFSGFQKENNEKHEDWRIGCRSVTSKSTSYLICYHLRRVWIKMEKKAPFVRLCDWEFSLLNTVCIRRDRRTQSVRLLVTLPPCISTGGGMRNADGCLVPTRLWWRPICTELDRFVSGMGSGRKSKRFHNKPQMNIWVCLRGHKSNTIRQRSPPPLGLVHRCER